MSIYIFKYIYILINNILEIIIMIIFFLKKHQHVMKLKSRFNSIQILKYLG